VRLEELDKLKNPMTSSGIESATFRLKKDIIFLTRKVTNTNTDDDDDANNNNNIIIIIIWKQAILPLLYPGRGVTK
jgi:hypothetical protein